MTKTLADMTVKERQACVGMWADTTHCALQGIILDVSLGHARVLITENLGQYSDEEEYIWVLKNVVPRFDLMRAWNPDGTPSKGEWVDGHMWWNEPGDDSQTVDLIGAECLGTGEMQGMDKWPENVTPAVSDEDIQVRRFITEWENTDG